MEQQKGNSLMFDIIEKMDYMVRVIDEKNTIIYMNEKMRALFGDKRGKKCYELLSAEGKCINCISQDCKMSDEAEAKDVEIDGRVYRIIASPVSLDKSEKFSVEIFDDVTEQNKIMEENLRHYAKLKEDIEFAKQIQTRALPADGEYFGSLAVESCYRPSEALGGDTFDIVRIDEDRCLFYIADVSGHGIRSSLLTIFLRQIIRGMKEDAGNLKSILTELFNNYNDLHMGNEQYFSVLLGLYDRKQSSIRFINGGHNCLPLILKKNGKIEEIDVTGLPVCRFMQSAVHKEAEAEVSSGDRVILYTDGISEAYNQEKKQSFALEGLLGVIASESEKMGRGLAVKISDAALDFVNQEMADDMAVVVIEIL